MNTAHFSIAALPILSQALDDEQVLVRFQGKAGPPKSPDLLQSAKHPDDLKPRFNLGFVAYLYIPRTPKAKSFEFKTHSQQTRNKFNLGKQRAMAWPVCWSPGMLLVASVYRRRRKSVTYSEILLTAPTVSGNFL